MSKCDWTSSSHNGYICLYSSKWSLVNGADHFKSSIIVNGFTTLTVKLHCVTGKQSEMLMLTGQEEALQPHEMYNRHIHNIFVHSTEQNHISL